MNNPRLCPPPALVDDPYRPSEARFADSWKIFNDMIAGRIRFDTPAVELESPMDRAACVRLIESEPTAASRGFFYTVTYNDNPGDPREFDYDRWMGPVRANVARTLDHGEKWYRIGEPRRAVDYYPSPVLAAACALGDPAAFDAALAAGADVHFSDGERSPVYQAVVGGRLDMLESLIAAGLQLDRCREARWLLLSPVATGHHDMVRRLLSFLPVSPDDLSGLLGSSFDVATAELLAAAGARPDARLYWDETPLHILFKYDPGKPEPRQPNLVSLLDWLIAHGAQVDAASKGRTALHAAVNVWHAEAIGRLIELGASLDARDEYDGCTPRDTAVGQGRGAEFDAIVVRYRKPVSPSAPIRAAEPLPPVPAVDADLGDLHEGAGAPRRHGLFARLFAWRSDDPATG